MRIGKTERKRKSQLYLNNCGVEPDLYREAIFLGLLTDRNIKPLSRIEYSVNEEILAIFTELSLMVEELNQIAQNGNTVKIILISKHKDKIAKTKELFEGKSLDLSPNTIREWGKLLGFPECCVEFFVNEKTRHAPNGFSAKDQELLFHWACPDCRATKKLIPLYKKAWQDSQILFNKYLNRIT